MMHGPMRNGNKKITGSGKEAFIKLIKSLKKYYFLILLSMVFIITSVVLSIIAPNYLKKLTNLIAYANGEKINMDKVYHYTKILVIMYGINALMSFTSGIIMNTVTQKYAKNLRTSISEKLNKMPFKYFDSNPYGNTLSIVTNDVDTIAQSLQQATTMLLSAISMLIGVLIAMFYTNWKMSLTVIVSLPLMMLMIIFITKLAVPQFKKRQHHMGLVNAVVDENFSGAIVIKLFNADKKRGKKFEAENEELHRAMIKAQIFGGMLMPISTFISYFAYSSVCIIGGLLIVKGDITYGVITQFLVYVNLFQSPLSQLGQAMNTIQMALAASSRVFDLLEEGEEENENNKEKYLVKEGNTIKGDVVFDHVAFGYNEDKIIIKDFSCNVKSGMKVAIVGPTGAGKTTLVNLLMRFYETNSGNIYIDGVSIKDMSRSEVRDIFSMVLQDSWIFEGSIRENIVYSTEGISDEKLNKALDEACLSHYVNTLEHGVDTVLKGESSLSQGQRQLLTIARAFIKNAPLLILDEATSNVDTRTEILIQKAMDNLTSNRTSFVIAHRLSTIKNADLILVLKDGNIIEQGNHNELMALNGFYSDLYNSQFNEE